MKHRILSLLLALCLLASLLPAAEAAEEKSMTAATSQGFSYAFVSPDTIEITAYAGYEAEVTVPSSIDGYTVVGIQSFHTEEGYSTPNVFVHKVILPETVTYIADEAFYSSDDWAAKAHSELHEIVLPQSLKTIGKNAFYNNYYLQSIDIPAGVTEIGTGAFAKCQNLSSITFRGENTFLWGGAFGGKTGYGVGTFAGKISELHQAWLYDDAASDFFVWQGQLLDYKGTGKTPVIPDTVSVIGAEAFWRLDITGVTIPSGVRLIGQQAFYECESLASVDIPGSVWRIDDSAFSGCKGLTSVTLHEGLKVIGDGGFRDCEGLTSLTLPQGLTTLEDTALYDCSNIEHFSFPASLSDMEISSIDTSKWYESLADDADLYCGGVYLGRKNREYPTSVTVRPGTKMVRIEGYLEGLNELILPEGLESLILPEAGASYCGITRLNVPDSVNYINVRDMSSLTDITLPKTAVLESGCFYGCYKIKNLTIPRGNQTLESVGIGQTENLVLPDDVLEVRGTISNGSPFSDDGGNSFLKSVDLKNVRILTGGALSGSVALQSVTLPDSLMVLGEGAFSGCARLRSVKGGRNVRQIGMYCFRDCPMLTDFGSLGTNVTSVGMLAFLDSGWFHDQPNGVVYFGKVAYAYKGSMAEGTILNIKEGTVSVTYEFLAGQTELNPDFNQPNLAGLILPKSCKYIEDYAFAGATNMKFIDLGGAEYIGAEAFNNSGCESIVLPDTVRYVGNNAFSAPHIQAIHLNEGLLVLDEGAFFTYGKGSGVAIPASVNYIGYQAFGYCPVDPDNPFAGLTKIEGFVITGTPGTAAQTYATDNEFAFSSASCAAHRFVSETLLPTCQSGGFTRQTCALCGYVSVTGTTAPTGHQAVANDSVAAACERPGFSGGTHCGFCGAALTQPTQTPALGHDEVVATEEYPYSAYVGMIRHYCRRCELKWYETNGGSGHVHDYTYQINTVHPTCIADGYTEHLCACGDSYRDSYTAALGHNYVNGVCTRCGHVEGTCDGGPACPSAPFQDVNTGLWYHFGIDFAITRGLMNGISSNQFAPEGAMNRAMLVTVLWRYAGSPNEGTNSFADVPQGLWYTQAVAWAAQNGIVNGIGSNRFDPMGNITREQMAAILYRYAGRMGIDTSARSDLGAFPDSGRVSGYASDALSWCLAKGIINGNVMGSRSYLDPQGNATRAQVATILMRFIQNVIE